MLGIIVRVEFSLDRRVRTAQKVSITQFDGDIRLINTSALESRGLQTGRRKFQRENRVFSVQ